MGSLSDRRRLLRRRGSIPGVARLLARLRWKRLRRQADTSSDGQPPVSPRRSAASAFCAPASALCPAPVSYSEPVSLFLSLSPSPLALSPLPRSLSLSLSLSLLSLISLTLSVRSLHPSSLSVHFTLPSSLLVSSGRSLSLACPCLYLTFGRSTRRAIKINLSNEYVVLILRTIILTKGNTTVPAIAVDALLESPLLYAPPLLLPEYADKNDTSTTHFT